MYAGLFFVGGAVVVAMGLRFTSTGRSAMAFLPGLFATMGGFWAAHGRGLHFSVAALIGILLGALVDVAT